VCDTEREREREREREIVIILKGGNIADLRSFFKVSKGERNILPVSHHSPNFMSLNESKIISLRPQNLEPRLHRRNELGARVQQMRRLVRIMDALWRRQNVDDFGVGETDVVQNLAPYRNRKICRRRS
jgi:hypothetical protein